MSLDPVLDLTIRAGLALLFASTALTKLRDLGGFTAAVAGYRLLPERLARGAALGFVAAELALAAGLLVPALRAPASLGAAGLLVVYAAAIAWNLARGRRDIDCGCGGPFGKQTLSEGLVLRNLALAAAALASTLPVAERALGWLDLWTVLAALACGALLFAAANALRARPVLR
jgi:hypothetical protein